MDKKIWTQEKKHTDIRDVPLPSKTGKHLQALAEIAQGEFVFSLNGVKPLDNKSISQYFHSALARYGISREEQTARGLTFHAWRHWLNTALRAHNITDGKLRLVMGHKTPEMTERYTSFSLEDFQDVSEVQEELFAQYD